MAKKMERVFIVETNISYLLFITVVEYSLSYLKYMFSSLHFSGSFGNTGVQINTQNNLNSI